MRADKIENGTRLQIFAFGIKKICDSIDFIFYSVDNLKFCWFLAFTCSLVCCTHNPNWQLEHQHILNLRSCQGRNMMGRLRMYGPVV
ncbi:unnamed protein product [Coffea canephora]|uniref:DH200=94 genomic scaffold, scaffold_11917 n=1 Tax=Coffea canephora TaxID=49390 RepID=A0A068VR61_COFCA|nr:unnamed protein product [Coffea canephora]